MMFGNLLNCLISIKELVTNEFLKLKITKKIILENKIRLTIKGFTKKSNYNKIFSLIFKINSLRIVMKLIAHYIFELCRYENKFS